MSRSLALCLVLLVGLAPAWAAAAGPALTGLERDCGCCCAAPASTRAATGEITERAPASRDAARVAPAECSCSLPPSTPPGAPAQAPAPAGAEALHAFDLARAEVVAVLPVMGGGAHTREHPAPPAPAVPVRERLGVWLL